MQREEVIEFYTVCSQQDIQHPHFSNVLQHSLTNLTSNRFHLIGGGGRRGVYSCIQGVS